MLKGTRGSSSPPTRGRRSAGRFQSVLGRLSCALKRRGNTHPPVVPKPTSAEPHRWPLSTEVSSHASVGKGHHLVLVLSVLAVSTAMPPFTGTIGSHTIS
ncbi:hypothetical protein E2562_005270 [Oryza meyeriana var. granulata]|uniref:Uncharacterized protein n=1 Tax=Oryza meyeriana var. granulata TaxID=110450 RepID=A0A6G1EEX8_9ORYZ|nr:hypothetical protein E2562_005270 [Oryza meyeriana var. granulata]